MTRRVRIFIASLLFVLLLAAGALWLAADRLFDGTLRPWLTAKAAAALDAEVRLEQLSYADGRLYLTGLTLVRPAQLHLEVAAIELRFTWFDLLRGRIEEVLIRQPRLTWTAPLPAAETAAAPAPWPQQVPLRIDAWRLEDGRAELNWGERSFLIEELVAEGSLGHEFPLQAKARWGNGPGVDVSLAGTALWQQGLSLTLHEFSWEGQNLLTRPVQIAQVTDLSFAVQLRLAQLDAVEAAGLLRSLGEPLPWPADLHWQVLAPKFDVNLQDGSLVARLQTASGAVQTTGQTYPWQSLTLRLQGTADRFELTGSAVLAGSSRLTLTANWAERQLNGRWQMTAQQPAGLLESFGVLLAKDLPPLGELSVDGGLHWQDGRLSLSGIVLSGQLAGALASTRLSSRFELRTSAGLDLLVLLESLHLQKVDYQSEDGMTGLAGGDLVLQGRLELSAQRIDFELNGQAEASEALLQSWYGDLTGLPVSFAGTGSWLRDQQRLELSGVDVDLAGLVNGRFSAAYSAEEARLRGRINIPRLSGRFQQTLHDLTGDLAPGLAKLSMHGRLDLEGSAWWQGAKLGLDLNLQPEEVAIVWGENTRIDGLRGRLPVSLRQGGAAADTPAASATLHWSRLQGPLFNSADGRLELAASPNRWQLKRPLQLATGGGTASLTALQIDLLDLQPQLRGSLEMTDIDLVQVTQALDWPPMNGRLSASFGEIRISTNEISTLGTATVQAFGGDFTIANLRVDTPFSRFPTYHADIDFTGVDLYPLTSTFAFGEMNGIVDGHVHNLRLFDGVPSAFHAKLESRPEGRRNISVKALRNLNTISQGGLTAALSQGIYRFIDFYQYRKIGILCWLQNDLFRLEGTGRADSDRYLIYGGLLPPRIDVVISSASISFKEMMNRLKRIERADH